MISLIPSPHNLHNYDELGLPWIHRPFGPHEDDREGAPRALPRDAHAPRHWPEGDPPPGGGGRPIGRSSLLATYGGRAWCPKARKRSRSSSRSPSNSSVRSAVRSSRSPRSSTDAHTPERDIVTDQIEVRGIRALGIIGVCREEQERPQPFEIDFDVDTDVSTAGQTDDLADTIDYGALIGVVFHCRRERAPPAAREGRVEARRRAARVRRPSARGAGHDPQAAASGPLRRRNDGHNGPPRALSDAGVPRPRVESRRPREQPPRPST